MFTSAVFAAEVIPVNEGNGMAVPPNSNATTCEDIGLTSNLKKGKKGTEVEILQEILLASGYYEGEVDGRFGNITKKAVKALQTALEIEPDGVVGPITREAMRELCAGYVQGS